MYRLHEWGHYLAFAGQFPESALSHSEDGDAKHVQVCSTLTSSELQHLDMYYKQAIPQYGSLSLRYETAKKRAKNWHQVKQFPPFSSWEPDCGLPLTPVERTMHTGLSVDIARMDHFTYRDVHGREVRLSSMKADTESSSSSYGILRQQDSQCLTVGHISFFFEHTFVEGRHTFAFVKWLGSPRKDLDSGILNVCLESEPPVSINPVIPICKLVGPLVTAIDVDMPNKLWILSSL